jgi:hypothetical protein
MSPAKAGLIYSKARRQGRARFIKVVLRNPNARKNAYHSSPVDRKQFIDRKKGSSKAGINRSACRSPHRTNNQARTAFDWLARSTVERRAGFGGGRPDECSHPPRKDVASWISVHRGPPMRLSLI